MATMEQGSGQFHTIQPNQVPQPTSCQISRHEYNQRETLSANNKIPLFGPMTQPGHEMDIQNHQLVFMRKSLAKQVILDDELLPCFAGINGIFASEGHVDAVESRFRRDSGINQPFSGLTKSNFRDMKKLRAFVAAWDRYRRDVQKDLVCVGIAAHKANIITVPLINASNRDPTFPLHRTGITSVIHWARQPVSIGQVLLWKIPDLDDLEYIWFGDGCQQHVIGEGYVCPIFEVVESQIGLTWDQRSRFFGVATSNQSVIGESVNVAIDPLTLL